MDWIKVSDDLPVDDRLVLAWGRYVADRSDCHEVAKFRRAIGWNVAPFMEVEAWTYFDEHPSRKSEAPAVKESETKKKEVAPGLFNR